MTAHKMNLPVRDFPVWEAEAVKWDQADGTARNFPVHLPLD